MLTEDPNGTNSRDQFGLLSAAEIRKAIIHACMANKCLPLARKIKIEYSHRFVRKYGHAELGNNRIVLSAKLFPRIRPAMQRDTVIHEVCHLIAFNLYQDRGHGKFWKMCMMLAGGTPKSTAKPDIDTSDLHTKAQKSPYKFACACRKVHELTYKQGERVRLGAIFRCKTCKSKVMVIPGSYSKA